MAIQNKQIHVVLFDVGGVLVELSGVPTILAWMGNRASPEELWRMWLTSPAVRAFETGRMAPEMFADQLIAEMDLPVGRDRLLEEFTRWMLGPFPGALDLVSRIPGGIRGLRCAIPMRCIGRASCKRCDWPRRSIIILPRI